MREPVIQRQYRCPLPVVREQENPADLEGDFIHVVGTCNEYVCYETASAGGPIEEGDDPDRLGEETVWKVYCLGGHVLIVPDDEGNGRELPLTRQMLAEAMRMAGAEIVEVEL